MQPLSSERTRTAPSRPGRLPRRCCAAGRARFFAASLLLPRSVREPASALYAFCRLADDAVDLEGDRVAALAQLRERLERAYEGRPLPFASDRALADVVARFAIPRALPEALLEGFEWDAAGRRYDDLSGLYAYAARVAGTVGAMMALLMGVRGAGGAGPRLRPGRGDAAHEHRPRRRRGRARRSAVPAARVAARRRASTPTLASRGPCSTPRSDR